MASCFEIVYTFALACSRHCVVSLSLWRRRAGATTKVLHTILQKKTFALFRIMICMASIAVVAVLFDGVFRQCILHGRAGIRRYKYVSMIGETVFCAAGQNAGLTNHTHWGALLPDSSSTAAGRFSMHALSMLAARSRRSGFVGFVFASHQQAAFVQLQRPAACLQPHISFSTRAPNPANEGEFQAAAPLAATLTTMASGGPVSDASLIANQLRALTLRDGAPPVMDAAEAMWAAEFRDGNVVPSVQCFELMIAGHLRIGNIDAALQWTERLRADSSLISHDADEQVNGTCDGVTALIPAKTYNAAFAALLERSANALRAFETNGQAEGNFSAFRVRARVARQALQDAFVFWRLMRGAGTPPDARTFALIFDLHVCDADFDGALRAADAMVGALPVGVLSDAPQDASSEGNGDLGHPWSASLCAFLLLGCSCHQAFHAFEAAAAVCAHSSGAIRLPAGVYAAFFRQIRADGTEEQHSAAGENSRVRATLGALLVEPAARLALDHSLQHAGTILESFVTSALDASMRADLESDFVEFSYFLRALCEGGRSDDGERALQLACLLARANRALNSGAWLREALNEVHCAWLQRQCVACADGVLKSGVTPEDFQSLQQALEDACGSSDGL